MDVIPSSSQSLNQDFIKSTTSKSFAFLLCVCSRTKTSRCSRWLCCTYLGQGDQSLWLVSCCERGVLGSKVKPRTKWNWFQSILVGVREEEKVVLILEIRFQVVHQRKKNKKRLSEFGLGRMKITISEEEEKGGADVRIRANGEEWSIYMGSFFWHFSSC